MWLLIDLFVMAFWTVVNIIGIGGLYLTVHCFRTPGTNTGGKIMCASIAIIICCGYLFALGVFWRNRGWWPKRRQPGYGKKLPLFDGC